MARVVLAIGSALVSDEAERHGLRPLGEARTAPRYRLLSVEDRWAALVEDEEAGIHVPGRLFEVSDDERWEALLAGEPPGLLQRPVALEDGREGVTAAFADESAQARARDITSYGGFVAYLAARNETG
jgi:hypothetical protein